MTSLLRYIINLSKETLADQQEELKFKVLQTRLDKIVHNLGIRLI